MVLPAPVSSGERAFPFPCGPEARHLPFIPGFVIRDRPAWQCPTYSFASSEKADSLLRPQFFFFFLLYYKDVGEGGAVCVGL